MTPKMENKIRAMFWDMPEEVRDELVEKTMRDASVAFSDEKILSRALNTLTWYDLIEVVGPQRLKELLSDENIRNLYPRTRVTYYQNARRLLSKYIVPSAG